MIDGDRATSAVPELLEALGEGALTEEHLSVGGVGAWVVPKAYSMRMVVPADSWQQQRISWAVTAIQDELERRGYLHVEGRGQYGPLTQSACAAFQRDHAINGDGAVGPITASQLWLEHFRWYEAAFEIPEHLLYGEARLESYCDPGAEGTFDGDDRGMFQISRKWNPQVSDETAFRDVPECMRLSAERMRAAYDTFGSWDAAVMNHNNPSKARAWARDGVAPDEQARRYVELVRVNADRWPE